MGIVPEKMSRFARRQTKFESGVLSGSPLFRYMEIEILHSYILFIEIDFLLPVCEARDF